MNQPISVKNQGEFSYHIYIEDSFAALKEALTTLSLTSRRICIVTDSHVERLYLQEILQIVSECCKKAVFYVIPAGEDHKNLDEIRKLYAFLIEEGFDRKDYLLALGGGVIGDMTGFAAATYLRGISFIQVPTTLLSQVDSSIGGKTGVDFDQYKNMVGAFHMPALVYINPAVLRSLPDNQYASGMAEILKAGLIKDADYYEWLIDHMSQIEEKEPEILREMIDHACRIKQEVVEKDPTEKGERALLNFGHTIGHAIEKLKNFQLAHGECVALGTVAAAHISWKRGYLEEDEFYEIRDMSVGFDLPISFDGLDTEAIVAATRKDKKMDQGHIRFILLQHIGEAFIAADVTEEEMRAAINSINAEYWEVTAD